MSVQPLHTPAAASEADAAPTQTLSISQHIAEFAANLTYKSIPKATRENAKYHVLDVVGTAIAATRFDFAQHALSGLLGIAEGGKNSVIGMGVKLPLRDAVLLNTGAALFVAVHHDSMQARLLSTWTYEGAEYKYGDRFEGFSLFVSRENAGWKKGLACASAIGAALIKAGFKPSLYHADPKVGENRAFADKRNGVHYFDRLAVLRNANMPALLFEAGVKGVYGPGTPIPASAKDVLEQIKKAVG